MGGQVEPANSGNAQPAHEGNGSDNRKKGRQGASIQRLFVQCECLRVFVRKRWALSNECSRTVFSLCLSASVPPSLPLTHLGNVLCSFSGVGCFETKRAESGKHRWICSIGQECLCQDPTPRHPNDDCHQRSLAITDAFVSMQSLSALEFRQIF